MLAIDVIAANQKEWGCLPGLTVLFLMDIQHCEPEPVSLLLVFLISCQISLSPGGPWFGSASACFSTCFTASRACPVVLLCPSTHATTPPFPHNLPAVPECHPVHLLVENCDACGQQISCKSARQGEMMRRKSLLMRSHLKGDDSSGEWAGLDCFRDIRVMSPLFRLRWILAGHTCLWIPNWVFFYCLFFVFFFPPTSSKNTLQPTHSRQNSRHLRNLEAAF